MLFEIVRFEIIYRLRQYNTYVYFILLFLFSIVATAIIFEGQPDLLKSNTPIIIARTMGITTAFFLMVCSMIMGTAVLKDAGHRIAPLLFVTPVTKSHYFIGRWLGAFVILVFVFTAVPLGMMLGNTMPWHTPDKLIAFNAWHYLQPFFLLIIPTLFFTGALFFVTGALSRTLLMVYSQGFVLLLFYLLALNLEKSVDNPLLAGLLDPFTFHTIPIATSSWSTAQRNTVPAPLTGILLYNRLVWITLGSLILAIGYRCFHFTAWEECLVKKSNPTNKAVDESRYSKELIPTPLTQPQTGIKASCAQLLHLIVFNYKSVVTTVAFRILSGCGIGLLYINSLNPTNAYGVNNIPVTATITGELMELTWIFFLGIILFYSGELVWKDRYTRIHFLTDSLPVSNLLYLSAQLLGCILVLVLLIFILMGAGVLFQSIQGYYHYQPAVYIAVFFIGQFPLLLLFSITCFACQVLMNNKYLAQLITLVLTGAASFGCRLLGLDHGLITFGGSLLPNYSDMNGYGHFLQPYCWIKLYWCCFSFLLFIIAVFFSARGTDSRKRRRQGYPSVKYILLITTLLFLFSGGYIFYNTNLINRYAPPATQYKYRADYERLLQPLLQQQQPVIKAIHLQLDLYPYKRTYWAKAQYLLYNPGEKAIREIAIQKLPGEQVTLEQFSVQGGAVTDSTYLRFGYYILKLHQPLRPHHTLPFTFTQHFYTPGFTEHPDHFVVYNGTFLDNYHFPSIGYNNNIALKDAAIRARYGLPPAAINDSIGLLEGKAHGDGEDILLEIMASTSADQLLVAPGDLKATWIKEGRRYFHYSSNKPISNNYALLSARYKALREHWHTGKDNVDLELYYHPGHPFNIAPIINGMKKSLHYYSDHFAPYPYQQLRLAEIPAYHDKAQSFPGLITMAENTGFTMNVTDKAAMDMPFFITAHETAHQWWGHLVNPANVQGKTMLSETLAQYAALMVFKKEFSTQQVHNLLRWNMKQYVKHRSATAIPERPLSLVGSGQEYVHYHKGLINLNTFQHYVSEDSVNKALQRFIIDWNSYNGLKKLHTNRYPTTNDLLYYFKQITPDSLQYIIQDLFTSITLYDNKLSQASYKQVAEHQYEVTAILDIKKLKTDSLGNEAPAVIHDWIELGIYTKEAQQQEQLVSVKKSHISTGHIVLKFSIPQKPSKIVLDPYLLLIDHSSTDNERSFRDP